MDGWMDQGLMDGPSWIMVDPSSHDMHNATVVAGIVGDRVGALVGLCMVGTYTPRQMCDSIQVTVCVTVWQVCDSVQAALNRALIRANNSLVGASNLVDNLTHMHVTIEDDICLGLQQQGLVHLPHTLKDLVRASAGHSRCTNTTPP